MSEPIFTDVVLDLETLGKTSDAVVISIGAVKLNRYTGEIGPSFHAHLDLEDGIRAGGVMDASTVLWWLDQSPDARAHLVNGQRTASYASYTLKDFTHYMYTDIPFDPENTVGVWGNGATFDCTILRNTYQRHRLECPWAFWAERDLRTVVDVSGLNKSDVPKPDGFIAHHAEWDSKYQAAILLAALAKLKGVDL